MKKVLHITNMYPFKEKPWFGIFIYNQIESLKKFNNNDVYFINGNKSKLNYFKALIQLRKYKNKYDIIHCHHGWTGIIANLIFRKNKKIISLVGGDILEEKIKYKKVLSHIVKKTLKNFDTVIVKSNYMKKKCKKYNSSLSVIPNGVDLKKFKELDKLYCKEKVRLDKSKKYFLFTAAANDQGRPEKRYDIIKKAKEILLNKGINNFDILCLSNVKHEEVPYYLNSCEAVLISSDYEGSPNIVKEAMACNVPILSTDVGNVKEMINNVKNCYIIKQDSYKFAEKMKEFIMSNNENRSDGRQKLKNIKLDQENVAKSIHGIYKSIILINKDDKK